jgi:predicted peptidase
VDSEGLTMLVTTLTTLLTLAANPMPRAETLSVYQAHELQVPNESGPAIAARYRLMAPPKLETGREYPLVVFLHGAGERGTDNALQLLYLPEWLAEADYRRRFPCYVLAPQCPPEETWAGLPNRNDPKHALPNALAPAARGVLAALDQEIAKHPIDRRRIYLTGLSMGGFGTWRLACETPRRFAAAAPICGGGDAGWGTPPPDLPMWVVHGADDAVVPPERSRERVEAFRAAGGKPHYVELPGVGHDSWTPAYRDPEGLLAWLFEQRLPEVDASKSSK